MQHRNEPAAPSRPALVLGGGGAFGVVQAAYVLAAFERGFAPKVVVGTSVGALNGAWIAFNPDHPEGLLRVWLELDRLKLVQLNPVAIARNLLRGRLSLSTGNVVPRLLDRYIGNVRFEDAILPLGVVATNLSLGQKHVFRSGPLGPAVLASTAIPGVYEPVRVDDHLFVDGCLVASVDLITAVEMGASEILAIDLTPLPAPTQPRSMVGLLKQSFSILTHAATDAMERSVAMQVPVRVVRPDLSKQSPWRLDDSAGAVAHNLTLARSHIRGALDEHGRVIAGWAWDASFNAAPEPATTPDGEPLTEARFFHPRTRKAA